MSQFSKNPLTHPAGPPIGHKYCRRGPMPHAKVSTFMYANDGSAVVAAKITGVIEGGKRKDDAPYFTNNEGIP
jgi:catalase